MNKKLKVLLAVILSAIGLVIIAFALFFLKFRYETSRMLPLETGNVTGNISAVKDGFVNFYLIKSGDGYIAVDGGYDEKNIRNELKKINIPESDVKLVFLTHSDTDHTAAVKIFKNAKVYASADEAPLLDGKKCKVLFFSSKLNAAYTTMQDNEVLTHGGVKVRIIFTPGHTPGSASYLVDDRYLFTGDTLSIRNSQIDIFNSFFNKDTPTERLSIEKIKSLQGVKFILTAHYGILKL